jgi:hypothetical protein
MQDSGKYPPNWNAKITCGRIGACGGSIQQDGMSQGLDLTTQFH